MLEIIITTVLLILVTAITQSGKKSKAKQKVQPPINKGNIDTISSDDLGSITPNTSSNTLTTMATPVDTISATKSTAVKSTTPIQTPKTPQRAKNAPKIASNDDDDTTFDLKKAVIYSEILTPKFKEEDF